MIGTLTAPLMKYGLIAAVIAIIGLGVTVYILHGENETLNQNLATARADTATAKAALEDQKKEVAYLKELRERDHALIGELSQNVTDLQSEYSEVSATLNGYRTRLDNVAIAKPKLLGRMATKATNKVFKDFEDATSIPPSTP